MESASCSILRSNLYLMTPVAFLNMLEHGDLGRSVVCYCDRTIYCKSRVNSTNLKLTLYKPNSPHLLLPYSSLNMTRPRLYNTPQEKLEAARRYRKTYYDRSAVHIWRCISISSTINVFTGTVLLSVQSTSKSIEHDGKSIFISSTSI